MYGNTPHLHLPAVSRAVPHAGSTSLPRLGEGDSARRKDTHLGLPELDEMRSRSCPNLIEDGDPLCTVSPILSGISHNSYSSSSSGGGGGGGSSSSSDGGATSNSSLAALRRTSPHSSATVRPDLSPRIRTRLEAVLTDQSMLPKKKALVPLSPHMPPRNPENIRSTEKERDKDKNYKTPNKNSARMVDHNLGVSSKFSASVSNFNIGVGSGSVGTSFGKDSVRATASLTSFPSDDHPASVSSLAASTRTVKSTSTGTRTLTQSSSPSSTSATATAGAKSSAVVSGAMQAILSNGTTGSTLSSISPSPTSAASLPLSSVLSSASASANSATRNSNDISDVREEPLPERRRSCIATNISSPSRRKSVTFNDDAEISETLRSGLRMVTKVRIRPSVEFSARDAALRDIFEEASLLPTFATGRTVPSSLGSDILNNVSLRSRYPKLPSSPSPPANFSEDILDTQNDVGGDCDEEVSIKDPSSVATAVAMLSSLDGLRHKGRIRSPPPQVASADGNFLRSHASGSRNLPPIPGQSSASNSPNSIHTNSVLGAISASIGSGVGQVPVSDMDDAPPLTLDPTNAPTNMASAGSKSSSDKPRRRRLSDVLSAVTSLASGRVNEDGRSALGGGSEANAGTIASTVMHSYAHASSSVRETTASCKDEPLNALGEDDTIYH